MLKATLRRFVFNLLPQSYNIVGSRQEKLGELKQLFNLFIHKFQLDFSPDKGRILDRRLGLGAVILLLAIEGRQK